MQVLEAVQGKSTGVVRLILITGAEMGMDWNDVKSLGKSLLGGAGQIIGGLIGRDSQKDAAEVSAQLQREFAQHGIRWRVADAQAAGVHPVYALSGSGASSPGIPIMADPLGEAIAGMGQNLSRAVSAQETAGQRAIAEMQLRVMESQIGENDARALYYRSEAARRAQANVASTAMPPGAVDPIMMYSGIGDSGVGFDQVQVVPSQISSPAATDPAFEAGVPSSFRHFNLPRTPDGKRHRLTGFSKDAQEAFESAELMGNLMLALENFYDPGFRAYVANKITPQMLRDAGEYIWPMLDRLMQDYYNMKKSLAAVKGRGRGASDDYRWSDVIRPGLQPYFQRLQRR